MARNRGPRSSCSDPRKLTERLALEYDGAGQRYPLAAFGEVVFFCDQRNFMELISSVTIYVLRADSDLSQTVGCTSAEALMHVCQSTQRDQHRMSLTFDDKPCLVGRAWS